MYQNSFLWGFPLTRKYRCFALCSSYSVMLPCWWETFWSLSPSDVALFFTNQCTTSSATHPPWTSSIPLCDTHTDQWPAPGKENHLLWQLHAAGLHHALFWHHWGLCLTVMAFDHCVAICKPLHYTIIMNRTRCNLLIVAAWAGGAVHAFSQFSMVVSLPFCGPNEMDHYYSDIFPLLKVACTDTYITGVLVVANSGMVALVTFVLLFGSYVIILFTLRNHSAEGRRKALSTCGSHIIVVILFFGPSIFAYLRPPTTFPEDKIFLYHHCSYVQSLNLHSEKHRDEKGY